MKRSLMDVLADELRDIYSAEGQMLSALPQMAELATSNAVRNAFSTHLKETRAQIDRLERIGRMLGIPLAGKRCKAMEGIMEGIKECQKSGQTGPLGDTCLIAAAQRMEHYQISAYGSALAIAERTGNEDIAQLLQNSLVEESETDELLSVISEMEVLPASPLGAPLFAGAEAGRVGYLVLYLLGAPVGLLLLLWVLFGNNLIGAG